MVNKCAAINCRSSYAKEKKDSNNTFHIFSFNDEKLLKHWVETNCKKISIHQRMPEFVSFILRQKTLFLILLINRTDAKEKQEQ